MIFKRKKTGPADGEPKTQSDIFDPADEAATPAGLATKPEETAEPPTRDAIFNVPPLKAAHAPPTGWVAIIAGPNKGEIIALGYDDTALKLANGTVSLIVTYDPAQMTFTLRSAGEDQVLTDRDDVQIGENTGRFIPLCAGGFDWRSS